MLHNGREHERRRRRWRRCTRWMEVSPRGKAVGKEVASLTAKGAERP
jgi:hypothetical protein